MNKIKLLIAVIAVLVISNGILLFMHLNRPNPKGEGPKDYIIEKLHFDTQQAKIYERTIHQHRKAIHENEQEMNLLRNALYRQLASAEDSSNIDSVLSLIAQQQEKAERINYNHFLEIKQICKPEQLKDFNELTQEIAQLFSPHKRK